MDKEIVKLVISLSEQIIHLKEIANAHSKLKASLDNPTLPIHVRNAMGDYRDVSQQDIMKTYAILSELETLAIFLEQKRMTPESLASSVKSSPFT